MRKKGILLKTIKHYFYAVILYNHDSTVEFKIFIKHQSEEDKFFFPISFNMIKLILYFYSKQIEQNDKLLRIKEPHFPDFL